MITLDQLQKISGNVAHLANYVDPLNKTFAKYEINTSRRIAGFLSQVIVETGGFRVLVENMNYTAEGLLKVFPSHFDSSNIDAYAHNPQRIGSRVYANRMGNGDEASGDGYTYRGRGLLQVTGKTPYEMVADDLGVPHSNIITYMESTEGACMSAGWVWTQKRLNPIADQGDIENISTRINGRTPARALADRVKYYNLATSVLG